MSAGWGKTCSESKHDKSFSCTGENLELMNGGEIIASAVSIHSNIDDMNATSRDGRNFLHFHVYTIHVPLQVLAGLGLIFTITTLGVFIFQQKMKLSLVQIEAENNNEDEELLQP